mmetsp:Transcript_10547/g.12042  ORF Transcript_10547/g.12042 Transcript_10547/m.12042 type:complete len:553 (+) Transcript_10547:657-2315(+)
MDDDYNGSNDDNIRSESLSSLLLSPAVEEQLKRYDNQQENDDISDNEENDDDYIQSESLLSSSSSSVENESDNDQQKNKNDDDDNDDSKKAKAKEEENEIYLVYDHLAMLHQPRSVDLQDEVSLSSLDQIFDPPKVNRLSNKKLLSAAMKGKEQEKLEKASLPDDRKIETSSTAAAQGLDDEPTAHSPSMTLAENRRKVEQSQELAIAIQTGDTRPFNSNSQIGNDPKIELEGLLNEEQHYLRASDSLEQLGTGSKSSTPILPTKEMRAPELDRSSVPSKPDDDDDGYNGAKKEPNRLERWQNNGNSLVDEKRGVSQEKNITEDSVLRQVSSKGGIRPEEYSTRKSMLSENLIREMDRLSGFIRRYENKLETVCKSLLTSASTVVVVDEEENEVSAAVAAKELSLPEMFGFIIEQDWYKAHSLGTRSGGLPRLMFSKACTTETTMNDTTEKRDNEGGSDGIEFDDNSHSLYTYSVTRTGKSFLQINGPIQADVVRFLAYLENTKVGLTKDVMLVQWKDIARMSGDIQSRRVCDNLNEVISFCLDFRMIERRK